jgi:hypothetical protein
LDGAAGASVNLGNGACGLFAAVAKPQVDGVIFLAQLPVAHLEPSGISKYLIHRIISGELQTAP